MMTRISVALVTIIAGLSCSAPALAQRIADGPGEPKPPAPIEKPGTRPDTTLSSKQTTGEVLSANSIAKTLVVVTTDRRQMTFLVANDAAPGLAQVNPGDTVTVRYIEVGGQFIAESIKG